MPKEISQERDLTLRLQHLVGTSFLILTKYSFSHQNFYSDLFVFLTRAPKLLYKVQAWQNLDPSLGKTKGRGAVFYRMIRTGALNGDTWDLREMKMQTIQILGQGNFQAQTASAQTPRWQHEEQSRLGGQQQEKHIVINTTTDSN